MGKIILFVLAISLFGCVKQPTVSNWTPAKGTGQWSSLWLSEAINEIDAGTAPASAIMIDAQLTQPYDYAAIKIADTGYIRDTVELSSIRIGGIYLNEATIQRLIRRVSFPEKWTSSLYRFAGSTHVFSAANTGHCLGYLTTIAPAYSWTNKIHDK